MTTAQDQQSRYPAEFEAWARGRGLISSSHGLTSEWSSLGVALEAWQAARALPAGVEPVGYAHAGNLANIRDGYAYLYPEQVGTQSVPLYTAAQVLAMGRVPADEEAVWEAFAEAVRIKVGVKELVNIMGSVDSLRETFLKAAHGITHPTGD